MQEAEPGQEDLPEYLRTPAGWDSENDMPTPQLEIHGPESEGGALSGAHGPIKFPDGYAQRKSVRHATDGGRRHKELMEQAAKKRIAARREWWRANEARGQGYLRGVARNHHQNNNILFALFLLVCYIAFWTLYTVNPDLDETHKKTSLIINIIRFIIVIVILIFQYSNSSKITELLPFYVDVIRSLPYILLIYLIAIYIYRFSKIAGWEWRKSQKLIGWLFTFLTRINDGNINNIDMLIHAIFYSLSFIIFLLLYYQTTPTKSVNQNVKIIAAPIIIMYIAGIIYYIYQLYTNYHNESLQ
jgi:hypothetical protein